VSIQDKGWALHYTRLKAKRSIVAGPVSEGDLVDMPSGRFVTVLSGRAPSRVKDTGGVRVTDSVTEGGLEARPTALGMVWVSASGGLAESLS
jgi:hypothetical protein